PCKMILPSLYKPRQSSVSTYPYSGIEIHPELRSLMGSRSPEVLHCGLSDSVSLPNRLGDIGVVHVRHDVVAAFPFDLASELVPIVVRIRHDVPPSRNPRTPWPG